MGYDKYGSGETFESCDKFGSGGVVWNGDPVATKPTAQQVQELKDALVLCGQRLLDELVPICQRLIDALAPAIDQTLKKLSVLWDDILKSYPDKRIVWLAFHHKKERVRKKNRHRIIKWIERMERQNGRCEMDQDHDRYV